MEIVELKDLKIITKNKKDTVGNLYDYNGRLIRIISESEKEFVVELINSKAFQELMFRDLFVSTWVCDDLTVVGNEKSLILEQEKVPFLTYCNEWTLEMQKAAAFLILDALRVLTQDGYELRCVDYSDVVMNGCRPMLCDIGSIKRINDPKESFKGYVDFYEKIYLRLKIQNTNSSVKQMLADEILNCTAVDPHVLYYVSHGIARKAGWVFWSINRFYLLSWAYYLGEPIPSDWNRKKKAVHFFFRFKTAGWGSSKALQLYKTKSEKKWNSLRAKINAINSTRKEKWANYANLDENSVLSDYRRRYIFDKISELGVSRTMEMGGNAGMFSSQLVKSCVHEALVTDFSREALTKGFIKFGNTEEGKKLNYAFLNFTDWTETGLIAKTERMRTDCLIVMALTHHLLLAQNVHLWAMVDRFADFTNKYLIVEFMPRGVEGSPIPKWYNKEWFEEGLSRRFDIVSMVSDEAPDHTRYIYTCKKNDLSEM